MRGLRPGTHPNCVRGGLGRHHPAPRRAHAAAFDISTFCDTATRHPAGVTERLLFPRPGNAPGAVSNFSDTAPDGGRGGGIRTDGLFVPNHAQGGWWGHLCRSEAVPGSLTVTVGGPGCCPLLLYGRAAPALLQGQVLAACAHVGPGRAASCPTAPWAGARLSVIHELTLACRSPCRREPGSQALGTPRAHQRTEAGWYAVRRAGRIEATSGGPTQVKATSR